MRHTLIISVTVLLIGLGCYPNAHAQQENSALPDVPNVFRNPKDGLKNDVPLIADGLAKSRPIDEKDLNATPLTEDQRERIIQKLLTGAKLKGSYTSDGKPLTELKADGYEIKKVQKLKPDGDLWVVHAKVEYDGRNLVVPVPVHIQWAESTPVIVLDNMMVPGFGSFSARVVFHGSRYAGTWQHDAVGGHLFGTIEYEDPKPEKDGG